MKCRKCNTENLDNYSFCINCGSKLEKDLKNDDDKNDSDSLENDSDSKHIGDSYCQVKDETRINTFSRNSIIFIVVYFVGLICALVLGLPWGFLVSLVSIVSAKIFFPKNILISTLFWLNIVLVVLISIVVMFFAALCNSFVEELGDNQSFGESLSRCD